MSSRINDIYTKCIPMLHKNIKIIARWMHSHPSRLIFMFRRLYKAHGFQLASTRIFLMTPDFVAPHVCGVKVFFFWIKNHSVNRRVWRVFVVLDALFQRSFSVHAEDGSMAGMFVERVAVKVMWCFLCS